MRMIASVGSTAQLVELIERHHPERIGGMPGSLGEAVGRGWGSEFTREEHVRQTKRRAPSGAYELVRFDGGPSLADAAWEAGVIGALDDGAGAPARDVKITEPFVIVGDVARGAVERVREATAGIPTWAKVVGVVGLVGLAWLSTGGGKRK